MGSLWILVVVLFAGFAVGYFALNGKPLGKILLAIQSVMVFLLMLVMGMTIGGDPDLAEYVFEVGLQAAILSATAIAGSVAMTVLIQNIFFRLGSRMDLFYEELKERKSDSTVKTALLIFLFMVVGLAIVRIFPQSAAVIYLQERKSTLVTALLCVMLFAAGIDIGGRKGLISDIKRNSWGLLIVPIGVILGSVIPVMLVGWLLGVRPLHAGAAGAACGWYTLSGVLLSEVDARLGALAFLLNLFRELASPIVIPLISKKFGPFAAVSPAAATSMDTMLTVIIRSTSNAMTIVAFANGVLLSGAVPPILGLFVRLM